MTSDPDVFALLSSGLAYCQAVAAQDGELLASLFVAGLVGSIGHCVGMCGPLVLGQTVARLEATPAAGMRELDRLAGAALVPYHLGRMTTYAGLGAAAAAVAGGVADGAGLRWLSAALLATAALLFLGYALQRLGAVSPWFASSRRSHGGESGWARTVGRYARPLFRRPFGLSGYALGLALGFLPCGLLYGALAAAASSGSALSGAMGMAMFALGTMPALVGVGFAGHVAGLRWRTAAARVTPVLLMLNAAALSYMAWRTVV